MWCDGRYTFVALLETTVRRRTIEFVQRRTIIETTVTRWHSYTLDARFTWNVSFARHSEGCCLFLQTNWAKHTHKKLNEDSALQLRRTHFIRRSKNSDWATEFWLWFQCVFATTGGVVAIFGSLSRLRSCRPNIFYLYSTLRHSTPSRHSSICSRV